MKLFKNSKLLSKLFLFLAIFYASAAFAQKSSRIVGIVKDAAGEPAIGVNVAVKGTKQLAITDADGNYVINAPSNGTLVFSYIGFKTQEVKINNRANIDVTLEEDNAKIDEVVVVGYGTARKISTIGAQSGVKFTNELKQPVATLSSVLAGRVAGVIGLQRDGQAGNDENTQIWIRGVSTTTSTKPLVLVDGVERSWTNIDPEDIESFQVLKDASATAVYGVKGANGVILIQTKKGIKGKPTIKFEVNTGITSFTKVPELADGITYMQMANEASMNRNGVPVYSQEVIEATYNQSDPMLYPNVNWLKEIFKPCGTNTRANINMYGGGEFSQYYVSLGYYNEGGLYRIKNDEQYNGRMEFNRMNYVSNITMQPTKTTQVDLGIKGEIGDYDTPYASVRDVFANVMIAYPTLFPVTYDDYKTPFIKSGGGVRNPYAMIHRMGTNKTSTTETRIDLTVKQDLGFILKGLDTRVLLAYDYYSSNFVSRIGNNPITYAATGRDPETGELILERTDDMNGSNSWSYGKSVWAHRQYYLEAALNYNNIFADKHRVSAMLLYNVTDYSNITAGSLYQGIPYRNLGVAGRATYSFDDRYFAEANFGYNGAENFAPGHRFGFFPSFGLAWVPSNEKFFPKNDILNFFKIRASWGQAGNSILDNAKRGESSLRFVYQSTVDGGSGYTFGDQRQNGFGGTSVGRPGVDVTWETSTKSNLGFDMKLFKSAVELQIDFFKERRENIFLMRQGVPDFIGIVTLPYGNLGIVENHGYEVTLDVTKKLGQLDVMFRGNYSFNRNKIIENDTPSKPYEWQEPRGHSLNTYIGYICDGFYTDEEIANPSVAKLRGVNTQAGDLKYRDLNEDGFIDAYDQAYIGKPTVPEIVYGLGFTLGWKGITFGAFFQGVTNTNICVGASAFKPFNDASAKGNLYANIVERWNPQNPSQSALWPRLDYGMSANPENYATSTFWLRDASYLRLKSMDLAYTFPNAFVKKLGLKNLRVYVQAYNVLTFTSFDMWDVELGAGNGATYPNIRSYNIGFNLSF